MKAPDRFTSVREFRLGHGGAWRIIFLCFALLGCASLGSVATQAQSYLTASGDPPFAAPEPVELGFTDTANGSLHGEIPIVALSQRATQPLRIKFVYNSNNIWSIQCLNTCAWNWNVGSGAWQLVSSGHQLFFGPTNNIPCQQTTTDEIGTIRTYNYSDGGSCTGDGFGTDSSGYRVFYTPSTGIWTAYAPDGTYVDGPSWTHAPEDTNGNYMSWDGLTDNLGRTIVSKSGSSCGAPGPCYYNVLNSQGGTSLYTITGANISVKTNFGQPNVSEYSGTMLGVVQTLTLPDGTAYNFKYDCDSTASGQAQVCSSPGGQSAYYGLLTQVTLPTGGTVSYGWTTFSDSYGNKARWLNTRQSGGGTWTYSPYVISTCTSTQVGCQQGLTVNKPSGASTVYTFTLNNGAWPVQIQSNDSSGSSLSTVNNTYDFSVPCPFSGCHGAAYIRLLTSQTTVTVPGASSITKKTAYTYDSSHTGNVTELQEWRYYLGTSPTFPSIADRTTYVSYLTTGTNDINRPLSVTVCNNSGSDGNCPGGGSRVSQTLYTYDSYSFCTAGLKSVSGVQSHDDTSFGSSFTQRGNATKIQRWVSGSTYLTSTVCYDTTGQVYQANDPAGNSTQYDYTENFFNETGAASMSSYTPPAPTHAYPKTVTLPTVNGVTLTSTFGYYYGSGKQAFSIDPSNQTTSHFFWDLANGSNGPTLDRPTETLYPIGWKLATYPSASASQVDTFVPVADTMASANCTSCQHHQVNLDTWGRKANEKFVNFPGGAVNVDTTYDSAGRVQSVSHAYINTSDPSHVFETFTYDGADRETAATHPDNQSARTAFGPNVISLGGVTTQQALPTTYGYGYPVITVDEAGKQRQEWLDGFGRIIEVDEPTAAGGTPGTGTVQITGHEQSIINCTAPQLAPSQSASPQITCPRLYDSGTVYVIVNGYTASANYGQNSTTASIATALTASLNGSSSPVYASVSINVITLTAKNSGSSTNYSLSTSVDWDSGDFSGPSFQATPSGSTLTGGSGGAGISSSPLYTAYTYDGAGRLTQVVQGLQSRTFTYDGLGRVIARTTPEAGTDTFYFTQSDNVSLCAGSPKAVCRRTDARGFTTTYTYDPLSRLTGRAYSNPTVMPNVCTTIPNNTLANVCHYYDQGGAGAFALGRKTSMVDASGSETYTYDAGGRVTQIQKVIGTTTFPIHYSYNPGGQVTQVTYPSNRVINQNIDNVGLLNTIVSGTTNYVSIPEPPTGYNAAGQLLTFTHGNGVVANFGYSSSNRGQMTSLSYTRGSTTLFSLNYGYMNSQANCGTGTTTGNDGFIQCIQDTVDNGRSVVYGYDPLNRLTSAVTAGSAGFGAWGLSESFDRYGNRLSQGILSGCQTVTCPTNALTFATTPAPPSNPPGGAYTNRPDGYSFDASGNMLNDGANNLNYDDENCLLSAGTTTYTCDAHGIRVKKALQGGTNTAYVFSSGQDIAEYDYASGNPSPGSPSREYIYLGGQLIATIQGTTTTYHHRDHLSVRVSTDANGNKIGEQGHFPYGEAWYASNATTKFIFTSYERDSESGNDYAMARYYINRFGRFSCVDPVLGQPGDPQSWNRYAYVRNNPINIIDPSGMNWFLNFLFTLFNTFLGLFTGGQAQLGSTAPGTPPIFDGGPLSDSTATLNSIYHPVDPSRFIISDWSPAAHDQMIQNALGPCGVPQDWIKEIQEASKSFDERTQDPKDSYKHSMSDGTVGQPAQQALDMRNKFIADELTLAQDRWNQGQTDNALADFGEAIHPVMDSTSPWHTVNGDPYKGNPIPWCGTGGCPGDKSHNNRGHVKGYLGIGGESAGYLSAHPEFQQKANSLIRSAFQIMTGWHLKCD